MPFHDMQELLDEILNRYGDCLDFVQLQINVQKVYQCCSYSSQFNGAIVFFRCGSSVESVSDGSSEDNTTIGNHTAHLAARTPRRS